MENFLADLGIDDIRALLGAKPISTDGMGAEWSRAPTSDPSRAPLFFHGGGAQEKLCAILHSLPDCAASPFSLLPEAG